MLVKGGDPLFLCHWMQEFGLADLLPSLDETLYVGLSAGSIVMAPAIAEEFVSWRPPSGGDGGLGLVDFAIFPHLENPDLPDNSIENAQIWADKLSGPAYAIDDHTAITVSDDTVAVVSEGRWESFGLDGKPGRRARRRCLPRLTGPQPIWAAWKAVTAPPMPLISI